MNDKNVRLTNPDEIPTEEILRQALGGSYAAYEAFQDELDRLDIEQEWQWYKPRKAWYARGWHSYITPRGIRKEKTLYWLHMFEGCFCAAVWFLEKNRSELLRENISDKTKQIIRDAKAFSSKLATFPVVFEITDAELPVDIYTLINCKKRLEG